MKFFRKKEILGIGLIFLSLIIMTAYGFSVSKKRERDFQRKLDLAALGKGLNLYKLDYDIYPLSSDNGKILACRGPETRDKMDSLGKPFKSGRGKSQFENLVECEWGYDSLMDITDVNYPHYLEVIPNDPTSSQGDYYLYFSKGESFIIMGSFEGKTEIEYSDHIKTAKISCGRRYCNFAKVSASSTLEKMLKEYENDNMD